MKKTVIVVGGGASGLMAAIAAARRGAAVTVLEGMERPGKKLLQTGNGRCNLTNLDRQLPEKYYGSGAMLARSLTQRFDGAAAVAFFEELGLLVQEKNGYVYPYPAQASAVLQVLLAELRRLHVRLKLGERVTSLEMSGGTWQVKTASWTYTAEAVILACGGKALPATGSDGSGYALARSLGHAVVTPVPALAPVACEGSFFVSLAGVRCRAAVSLFQKKTSGDEQLAAETGELQWTKYGVSGIVVFQLSRHISACSRPHNLFFEVDLLPDFGETYVKELLCRRKEALAKERPAALLPGILHEKLIPVIIKNAGLSAKKSCGELNDTEIERLIAAAKHLRLSVAGTKSFDACQVCAGGVSGDEVCPDTLESRKHRKLYFTGELLDVDGPCGGYNLQWAWASGYAAGTAAGQEAT